MDRRHALGLLAGLAAAMALTPDTDQFSQFLRLAFFRSPNYQAGVSGWTINQDGSVEFNNGTFRGHIVGGDLFLYTGTPGLGNPPIFSVTSSAVDPFGNAVIPNGAVSRSGTLFGELIAAALRFTDGSSPPFSVPTVYSSSALAAGTTLNVSPGKGTSGATGVTASLYDSLASAQAVAQVVIGAVTNPVAPSTTALLEVQGAIQTTALAAVIANGNLQSQLGDVIASAGNLLVNTIGKGLRVKEGSGAKLGTVLLSGGTATVLNANVTAASRILLTAQDNLSTGALRVSARTAGTSFTITSSNAGDSGSVAWSIIEPA